MDSSREKPCGLQPARRGRWPNAAVHRRTGAGPRHRSRSRRSASCGSCAAIKASRIASSENWSVGAGIDHRATQGSEWNIRPLRQHQRRLTFGHVDPALAERPDPGDRTEQGRLARSRRAGDESGGTLGEGERLVAETISRPSGSARVMPDAVTAGPGPLPCTKPYPAPDRASAFVIARLNDVRRLVLARYDAMVV